MMVRRWVGWLCGLLRQPPIVSCTFHLADGESRKGRGTGKMTRSTPIWDQRLGRIQSHRLVLPTASTVCAATTLRGF
ncbi:hypothetical protein QBC46DRAFT_375188 [Diplogelasinospora grovesii]|uniref:Secreted protein n=1 Tax=Diplogelasinospora grovesii TaxID=303347 RepID=A0AAN6S8L5_9PEZI|nr:hypothetical protein QBC46DRAFT_375188 [Diplogelasinospora grovesii]